MIYIAKPQNCSTSLELKTNQRYMPFSYLKVNQAEERSKTENVRNYMCSQMLLDSRHN
jgi:hypothetical protein